jgi:hypothetical protein
MEKHKKVIIAVAFVAVIVLAIIAYDQEQSKKELERESMALKMEEIEIFLSNLSFDWHEMSKETEFGPLYEYIEDKSVDAHKYEMMANDVYYYLTK